MSEWYYFLSNKDGERIDASTWTHHTVSGKNNRNLKIRNVRKLDRTGEYMCKGVNGYGSITFTFTLTIQGDDDDGGWHNEAALRGSTWSRTCLVAGLQLLKSTPQEVETFVGDAFSLTCIIKNAGQSEMRWLKKVADADEIMTRSSEKEIVKLEDGLHYKV